MDMLTHQKGLRKRSALAVTLALCTLGMAVQAASSAGPAGPQLDARAVPSTSAAPRATPRFLAAAPMLPADPPTAELGSLPLDPPGPLADPTPTPAPIAPDPTAAPRAAAPAATARPPAAPKKPAPPAKRVATRVAVPAMGINLAVMRQLTSYPACGVAMYMLELKQPGQGGVTYLYAHAQKGMFLPLLEESKINDGQRMLGMDVIVWTGDNLRFVYRIQEVRRHVTTLTGALQWKGESVFLQTSEGRGIPQKLQVVATFVSVSSSDYASAHPTPRPRTC